MSIKSDRWIRRMVEKHGMIDPFEPGQVREDDNGRIVSYGTSSYGYDVRCSDEFKIFTNINSAIVDPKGFDQTSFVSSSFASRVPCLRSALASPRMRDVASSST
jgi:dCTP deaminase